MIEWFVSPGIQKVAPHFEGYGAAASGGRGGTILFVDNLNDDGPGSLRRAVEADFARCIVFLVAGYIFLKRDFTISNGDLSIFGQTAPGMGICVRSVVGHQRAGTPRIWVNASNVVMMYLRSRPGAPTLSSGSQDAITIGSITEDPKQLTNIVIDHCSASWATDEGIGSYAPTLGLNSLISLQWCIMSEPLDEPDPPHSKGNAHGYANHWNGQFHSISIHHNLIAHAQARASRVEPKHAFGHIDYRYNTIYNIEREWTALRAPSSNYVGNWLMTGPDTLDGILMDSAHYANYIDMNYIDGVPATQHDLGLQNISLAEYTAPDIEFMTAQTAHSQVLNSAGASLFRDGVDQRIVADVRNGTGHIIDDPEEVGGWPAMTGGDPLLDSDGDGIPDAYWVSTNTPENGIWDLNEQGVTNFEACMNWYAQGSLAPLPPDPLPPDPPVPPTLPPGRYRIRGRFEGDFELEVS